MADFPCTVEGIDGCENDAGLDASQECLNELDAVREINGEPVAGLESFLSQFVRPAVRASFEISEGERETLEFKGRPIGATLEGQVKQVAQVHDLRGRRVRKSA